MSICIRVPDEPIYRETSPLSLKRGERLRGGQGDGEQAREEGERRRQGLGEVEILRGKHPRLIFSAFCSSLCMVVRSSASKLLACSGDDKQASQEQHLNPFTLSQDLFLFFLDELTVEPLHPQMDI